MQLRECPLRASPLRRFGDRFEWLGGVPRECVYDTTAVDAVGRSAATLCVSWSGRGWGRRRRLLLPPPGRDLGLPSGEAPRPRDRHPRRPARGPIGGPRPPRIWGTSRTAMEVPSAEAPDSARLASGYRLDPRRVAHAEVRLTVFAYRQSTRSSASMCPARSSSKAMTSSSRITATSSWSRGRAPSAPTSSA